MSQRLFDVDGFVSFGIKWAEAPGEWSQLAHKVSMSEQVLKVQDSILVVLAIVILTGC